ncbi:hypothetical protein FKR43_03400 [Neisseria meningitidis]|nr:hypothetical protein [Neisseria meningitidis]
MATSTNDDNWGFSIYNEAGIDLVNFGLFTPKYIGRLHLRLRETGGLGGLRIVAEDGREVDINDGSLNVPFINLITGIPPHFPEQGSGALRGGFIYQAPNNGIRLMLPIFAFSELAYKDIRYGLLPAVIHGWGSGFDKEKIEMADLMCRSLKSGSDILHAHLEMKHKDGTLTDEEKSKYVTGLEYAPLGRYYNPTGMPFTASFRSTRIGNHDLAGFSAVSLGCGYMVVDMAGGTDLEIYFYETAGLPYKYLCKCSTVLEYQPYGLSFYHPEPQELNYVMAKKGSQAEVNDGFNRSVTFSDLVVGKVERSRWFFSRTSDSYRYFPDTVPAIIDALRNGENSENRRKLAKFLEGDENAELKYSQYDSSMQPLKLLGAPNPKESVIVKRSDSNGIFYTLSGGNLSKAAQPVGIIGWDNVEYNRVGLPDGLGVGIHSLFQNKPAKSPYFPLLPTPADTFKWELDKIEPYQPVLNYRYSNMVADTNIYDKQFDLTGWQKLKVGVANLFNSRMASNLTYSYRQFNKAQAIAHIPRSTDIVLGHYKNPVSETNYYDGEIREAERRAIEVRLQAEARLEHEAAMWETQMEADRWDAEINEFKAKMGMLEQIAKIVNTNNSQYWQMPFWGMWSYRHGDDLELFCATVSDANIEETRIPLSDQWLCCRKPDF